MTRKEEQLDRELAYVLGDARGLAFLRRIVGRCGVYRSSFSPDAMVMSHTEGERNIGLWLISLVAEHENGKFTDKLTGIKNGNKRTGRDTDGTDRAGGDNEYGD